MEPQSFVTRSQLALGLAATDARFFVGTAFGGRIRRRTLAAHVLYTEAFGLGRRLPPLIVLLLVAVLADQRVSNEVKVFLPCFLI